ncbi:nuclear transcription factor Y subunit beta-like [Pteronotus mesoamericanus]|uniref:nuclear transcription factor Y subunit beta-like n=1 Tax=Pteronotus mesoamericanus TaxID=1884717 RepID=UPI0023EA9FEE|nr:nuclear transcription factor Y subunit beta-like [Pteronotus parnellii mesoamericanus]
MQPHDGTDGSMNDRNTNLSKESFREQDMYFPIVNVARIMKNTISQTEKIAKDDCELISFITSEASERCYQGKRKTISEDILFALCTLGFDSYVEPLKLYLQKCRGYERKGIGRTTTAIDEELTEEAFTNQLPAGLITADGQ